VSTGSGLGGSAASAAVTPRTQKQSILVRMGVGVTQPDEKKTFAERGVTGEGFGTNPLWEFGFELKLVSHSGHTCISIFN